MNGIDPRVSFWFGVFTSVLLLIASGTISLEGALPEAWVPVITKWCAILGAINSTILTAASGYSSNKSGPLANGIPAQVAKALILVAMIVIGSIAMMSPSHAQVLKRPVLTGNIISDIKSNAPVPSGLGGFDKAFADFNAGVQKIAKDVVDKSIADLKAAVLDATNHNDAISLSCWNANLILLQSLPVEWENPPTEIGLALGIQIQRDILNAITGDQATSLKVSCAALWGDQLSIVAKVGALIGVRVATAGLL
jgi:hypothetical protein